MCRYYLGIFNYSTYVYVKYVMYLFANLTVKMSAKKFQPENELTFLHVYVKLTIIRLKGNTGTISTHVSFTCKPKQKLHYSLNLPFI